MYFLLNCAFIRVYVQEWASQVALSGKEPICQCRGGDVRDAGLIPGWGRSSGGGHINPLQYSCLTSSMDRGAWWIIVHRVAKSWTWLKQFRMPNSGSARSYGSSIFSFLRNLQTVLYSDLFQFIIPPTLQEGSFSPYLLHHLLFVKFLVMATMTTVSDTSLQFWFAFL